jgi:DNA-binding transcriptional LysR family regulator
MVSMPAVDLCLLESFVVVAEELHSTRAAERLRRAQPALSQQMRRLEQQVGTPLFERRRQPLALTEAGLSPLRRRARRQTRNAPDPA